LGLDVELGAEESESGRLVDTFSYDFDDVGKSAGDLEGDTGERLFDELNVLGNDVLVHGKEHLAGVGMNRSDLERSARLEN